jgi:hypothetical protein
VTESAIIETIRDATGIAIVVLVAAIALARIVENHRRNG